ncbi:putative reverse transcriptase domain-containing protein [Tanacetum coccineum]
MDDVPFVEPNQHDDVPVNPKPVLVDEDEDLEEDEFEEEKDPQEEEDDIEVDIKEDENEPELTYPYEEMDSLNPSSSASESEPDDKIVYEVGELSTAAIPQEDGDSLLPGFMRWDIDSLFGRMVKFFKTIVWTRDGACIVRSSVEQGTAAMEKLVERLGDTEDKVECKKLKKEHEEARIMPPKYARITQADIRRMIKESVDTAIAAEQARQANVKNDASGYGPVRGHDTAPVIREFTFAGFMKCNLVVFHGIEGAVELRRWFEKTESVFEINECAEGKKVKFAAATLEGPALTWWKTKVATMGLETMNQMPWTKMKQLMTAEFCPIEEVQLVEHELWNLKVKEYDVVSYTQRFNELALMCPRMVEPERVKVDAYIQGLTDNIKGEVTSSKPTDLNEVVRMAHKLIEQKSQARDARILEGKKRKIAKSKEMREPWLPLLLMESFLCVNDVLLATWVSVRSSATSVEKLGTRQGIVRKRVLPRVLTLSLFGHVMIVMSKVILERVLKKIKQKSGKFVASFAIKDAEPQGLNMVTVNNIFEIDLMPIKLGIFDVIIGMDWLVKHDAVIVCGEKVVRIPYGNKTLIVEGDKGDVLD